MVIFKGEKILDQDKDVLRQFVPFVFDLLTIKQVHEQLTIIINFVHPKNLTGADKRDLIEYKAWMVRNSENSFSITINIDQVKQYPNQIARLKNVLLCLGHELVHVKQYLLGEMQDITASECVWKGQIHTNVDNEDENYWLAEWEIEAYGHEQGLFHLFKKTLTK